MLSRTEPQENLPEGDLLLRRPPRERHLVGHLFGLRDESLILDAIQSKVELVRGQKPAEVPRNDDEVCTPSCS